MVLMEVRRANNVFRKHNFGLLITAFSHGFRRSPAGPGDDQLSQVSAGVGSRTGKLMQLPGSWSKEFHFMVLGESMSLMGFLTKEHDFQRML